MSARLFNSILAVVTLAGFAWVLYRPKVQGRASTRRRALPLQDRRTGNNTRSSTAVS